jgi:hypothetical protein
MRHVITAATLTAFVGLGLAGAPTPGRAQDYDSQLADRLRDAIEAGRSGSDPLDLNAGAPAPLGADLLYNEELDELVAPIALYPDALLAQVLVAATYPFQIAKADQLIDASTAMTDQELSDALGAQEWDPSVLVLLSGFPTVIGRMAEDLAWTERLGLAMVQQDDDVLAAVQRMRARAEATGYLTTNEAQVVERRDDQLYIRPTDPDLIYVPSYDTAAAFTSPATATPYLSPQPQAGFSAQDALITGAIAFGSALLVNELFGNEDEDEDDEGWDDYWDRPGAIDWRERELYPRAYRRAAAADARQAAAWSVERDRYWDSAERRWRRDDAEARREYERERRDALERLERRERQAARDLRDWREGLREEERRRERRQERAAEDARLDAERDAARRQAERERDEERRRERERARAPEREDRAREAEREEPRDDRARAAAREQERERARRRAREQEQEQARERERRQAREREREQEPAREQERQQARERERQQAREQEQQQAREQERQQERQQARERERQQAREAERERARAQDREGERERRQAREREQAREPEREGRARAGPGARAGAASRLNGSGAPGRPSAPQERERSRSPRAGRRAAARAPARVPRG